MKVRIKWLGQMSFEAETGSGHIVAIDGPPEHGGQNSAARPMEMVLVGLGGCSAFDVVKILKKARQPIKKCEVVLEAERADAIPAVFTRIHLHYKISGLDLNAKQVKRAVELSVEKYCSVAVMLRDNVEISYDHEVQEAGNIKPNS